MANSTRLSAARARLDEVLAASTPAVLARVGEELFAVASVLDGNGRLRRALSDPARPASAKAELARSLFGTQVSQAATGVLEALVGERWPTAGALSDAVERAGVEAVVAAADGAGHLDALEDEVFRFRRIVESQPALRAALADRSAPVDKRQELASGLLRDRVSPETLRLVLQAVANPRGRRVEDALDLFGKVAAARHDQVVARVVSAVELTGAERERLAAALSRSYGREVTLRTEVDPSVVGGLRVQVGDEVVDGTVARRLDGVRQQLAG